ncbi:hypothetical protein QFC19_005936 [Naganishia cerealis]|uniref:Uncharacterized protein n=1 Tax=Naganishia cerealis TaxID=610337 RepID=A0ACC2VL16_9TREE|nr:hypothetical protein QFC19_005936 [Naganishia cerealis]
MTTERSPLLEPRLHGDENHPGFENDVVTFVQQRRALIATEPEQVPHFYGQDLTRQVLRASMVPERSLTLVPTKSHSSTVGDVSDILSHHRLLAEPETSVKKEIKVLLRYTFPLVLTFLFQYSLVVASVFSVGRIGLTELAAISLSSMTANISGYAIIQGISTCLDTLCAQAYGRHDYNMVGVHFARCTYLLLLLYIPMALLWTVGAEPILLLLVGKEETELCYMAARYLRVISMGVPGYILFENAKHFLQAQGIFHASTYVLAVFAPINALLNYLLVWHPVIGLGFIGAPLSVVITNWAMSILLFAYIYFVNGYQCWPEQLVFSKACFRNWGRMIRLSVPGVLMVEAEWLAFEIITFTASKFGTEVLAAQSIITTTCVLLYQIPFALSIAASTRIAWYIGAASKAAAKKACWAAILSAVAVGVVNFIVLLIFREPLASLYTNDKIVLALATKVLIVGAVYQVNDSLSCASGGILRGQGRQRIGGYLNLFGYYGIALPCAFVCAFYFKLELLGLWLGMIVALVVVSMSQCYFVVKSDWDQIINESINEGVLEMH